jgi:prepilin-type N-terminal cleavage/methylation domain-containing protein
MLKAAHHKTKGFTLLELLVVMSIVAFLSVMLVSGIFYLQNAARLDNSIRQMKAEIQSVQNSARNSFVSGNQGDISTLSNRKISLGWMITFTNDSATDSIRIVKRSIYFRRGNASYEFENLRNDIVNLSNILNTTNGQRFECQGDRLFYAGRQKNLTDPSTEFPIMCAVAGDNSNFNEEYIDSFTKGSSLGNMLLETSADGGISNCATTSPLEISFFFTSGYAEPSISGLNSNGGTAPTSCQMRIKNSGNFGTNFRAQKMDRTTGSLTICGSACGNAAAGAIKQPPIEVTAAPIGTPVPAPTVAPTRIIIIIPGPTGPVLE